MRNEKEVLKHPVNRFRLKKYISRENPPTEDLGDDHEYIEIPHNLLPSEIQEPLGSVVREVDDSNGPEAIRESVMEQENSNAKNEVFQAKKILKTKLKKGERYFLV